MLSIVFVDQVHYNLYHDILFLCSAFGYHERKGDECAVGDAFGTILTVENAVVVRFRALFFSPWQSSSELDSAHLA